MMFELSDRWKSSTSTLAAGRWTVAELAVLHTVCQEAKQLRIKLKSLVGAAALYLIVNRPVEVYGIVTYM
jgi:hypothetical protein